MRHLPAILGLAFVVGTLAAVKTAQVTKLVHAGKAMQAAGPPPETVSVAQSAEQTWEEALSAVGSVAAVKGVAVSNDAPGVVTRISFESGDVVPKGRVLVELDSSVERAQLASAVVRRDLAHVTARRSRALVSSASIPVQQADTDESQFQAALTDIGALEAQIARKIVRAPFAGRLGIRAVNVGQYLSSGTTIAVLESADAVYVDFTLPQQELADLKVGMPVRVSLRDSDGFRADGTVSAVDPSVDEATRAVRVRAAVTGAPERLRPGMFVSVAVVLPRAAARVVVPATAIVHASYGDSVFAVEQKSGPDGKAALVVRQQFVRLGETRGDFVAVLAGLAPNVDVVTAGAFKLRNGARVAVVPDQKPAPQLSPHPQNR